MFRVPNDGKGTAYCGESLSLAPTPSEEEAEQAEDNGEAGQRVSQVRSSFPVSVFRRLLGV